MKNLLVSLKEELERRSQPLPEIHKNKALEKVINPLFVDVVITSSTGGYNALTDLFSRQLSEKTAFFVVQHAPAYSLNNMASSFNKLTNLKLRLAIDGQEIKPGHVYIAPGDRHLCICPESLSIQLNQDPKENYARPAADPLFRSAALAFG
jgi:two-component system chemotaxis response regulator CheB